MKRTEDILVVYDISSTRERNKVSALLEGYGFRIQKSVFECCLTCVRRNRLLARLNNLSLSSGFVLLYRICPGTQRTEVGAVGAIYREEDYALVP